ncbi:MAG: selenocysteine-specific translation elongation factor [Oscillospiraceae bacterium]|nr:selenocysteine-specific translation elongation factor [Oscillospiraceae bacterium]
MKNICLGTAGHVDHGKTSLIYRLTGHHTSRLKEEISRGITIELGYAPLVLSNGQQIGIVDVPGHERFIRTMLVGATCLDVVLLVIAADEGVMPQTREHLDILKLLGVTRGIVVLTKVDMVDEEWMQLVREDVSEFLQDSPFCDAPVSEVSSVTGQGIPELLSMLEQICLDAKERPSTGVSRFAIDRVFIKSGFGTVVTGAVWGGVIRVGDTMELLPAGKQVRVRSLQFHGASLEEAFAGQRIAVNLANVEKEFAERGSWLSAPGAMRESKRIDVYLELLKSAQKMTQNSRVHVHHGTMEAIARVKLLGRDVLLPGESCFVQLQLDEPLATLPGDRVVLRHFSPMVTIGGGAVVEPTAYRHKGRDLKDSVTRLEALHSGDHERMLLASCPKKVRFWEMQDIASILHISEKEARELSESMIEKGMLVAISERYFYPKSRFEQICEEINSWFKEYFKQWPMRFDVAKSEVAQIHFSDIDQKQRRALFSYLDGTGLFKQDESTIKPIDWQPALTDAQMRVIDAVRQYYAQTPLNPPLWSEAVSELKIPYQGEFLQWLLRTGEMVWVTDSLLFTRTALNDAEATLRENTGSGGFLLAEARDYIQTPRKVTQIILEYFDNVKITHWDGERRHWR